MLRYAMRIHLTIMLAAVSGMRCCRWGALARQAESDLHPWAAGIAPDVVDQAQSHAFDWMHGFPRIVIENGKVHAAPSHGYEDFVREPHPIVLMVIKLLCFVGLPDLDIVVNPADHAVVDHDSKVRIPIWSWTKTTSHLDLFMPYWSAAWLPEPHHLQSEEEWNQRLTKMVFRGGSGTGHATSAESTSDSGERATWSTELWRDAPRSRLAQLCHNHTLCDAGFYKIHQDAPEWLRHKINSSGLLRPRVSSDEMTRTTKFTMLLHGNGPTASRSVREFGAGTMPFMPQFPDREYWYDAIQPHVHYLPVSRDLEDLNAKLQWAKVHNLESFHIAQEATRFKNAVLTNECVVSCHWAQKLSNYATLLRYQPSAARVGALQVELNHHQVNHLIKYADSRMVAQLNLSASEIHAAHQCVRQHTKKGREKRTRVWQQPRGRAVVRR